MKTKFNNMLSSGEVLKINNDLNGISCVKAGKGLINWLLKLVDIVSDERKPSWTRSSVVFIREYWRLRTQMGPSGTVKYLKACYVLTMQAVGGMKIKSTQSLGIAVSRSADGLPRIIPRLQRDMIRRGDRKALRIWLSWFSLYRIIEYHSFATLSTITSPGRTLDTKHRHELPLLLKAISVLWNQEVPLKDNLSLPTMKMLYKSSPTVASLDFKKERIWKYSASLIGIEQGAVSVVRSEIFQPFATFYSCLAYLCEKQSGFLQTMKAIAQYSSYQPGYIGRLGFKQEAAGKVRVFAMVDVWTQWLLGPLHDAIFELLRTFPTDGTFDQHAPVKRLIKKGYSKYWCFDLSAATDRLPVSLQASILDTLVGPGFGQAWMKILVNRSYQVPESGLLRPQDKVADVKYAVGQPMGALSSWGMLALTHHFLVMWSAKKAGYAPGTFSAYAVLGDDIVIANGPVAQQYLLLLEAIGVKIGLAKSLVSKKGALEFAKKYFVQGVDCSPVALKEVAAAVGNPTFGVSFLDKYELSLPRMLSVLGYGYRIKSRLTGYLAELPTRVRSLVLGVYSPWGPYPADVLTWLTLDGAMPLRVLSGSHFAWKEDIRALLMNILTKIDTKWPWFLEEHTVLRLKDLKFPKGTRWENVSDDTWGVYGTELPGDLLLIGTLQASVYTELQAQLWDLADCKQLAMDVKLARDSVETTILKLVELEKAIRLFRTPAAIAHADRKSNKIGLGFQIRLWGFLQDLICPISDLPIAPKVIEEKDDSKSEASSSGSTHLSWDELLREPFSR